MLGVDVVTPDGRRTHVVFDDRSMTAGRAAKLALEQLGEESKGETRVLYQNNRLGELDSVTELTEALVLVSVCPWRLPQRRQQAAATPEDIAKATGGKILSLAEQRASSNVQQRIHGFMASLFGEMPPGNDEENDEENDEIEISEESVAQLTGMGFSENASRRALLRCGGEVGAATDYLLLHAGESSLDAPLEAPGPEGDVAVDPILSARLQEMGFSENDVTEALRATRNSEELAVARLLGDGPDEDPLPDPDQLQLLANPLLRALLLHPVILINLSFERALFLIILSCFRAFRMVWPTREF